MKIREKSMIMTLFLLLVVVSLFASGKSKNKQTSESAVNINMEGWPIVKEKITVEMMASRAQNQADWNTLKLWEWVDKSKSQWRRIEVETDTTTENVTPKNGTHVPFINYDKIVRGRVLEGDEKDWQAKVYDGIDKHLHPYRRVPFPDAYMSVDQVNAVSALQTDINTYVDQMIARFIVGDEPFSNWDSYVKTIKNMGVDKLLAVYQEVYDAYNT